VIAASGRLPDRDAVVRAIETNMCAYWLSLGRSDGGAVYEGPDLQWAYTGRPVLNRVLGAQFAVHEAEARIGEIVRRFGAWRAGVAWLTGPSTRPDDLGARLRAQAFTHEGQWSGMAVDLASAAGAAAGGGDVAPGLTIREVRDGVLHQAWLEIIGAAFDLPRPARDVFHGLGRPPGPAAPVPWRRYVGLVNGRPVSTATLFAAGGAAGVYLVATLPGARRRGLGTALTRYVLAAARAAGHRLAVLQATATGQGVYRKLGFEEYCRIGIYRWSPRRRPAGWRAPPHWLARFL
jgi:ribosomal protein S18 acetylase RimI-like enzyme